MRSKKPEKGVTTYRRYPTEAKANALALLKANGYPDRRGSLKLTADEMGVNASTLYNWYHEARQVRVPPDLKTKKVVELRDAIKSEINGILDSMPGKREDADYRALGTVLGILFDKLQMLDGKPTQILDVNTNQPTNEDRAAAIIGIFESSGIEVPGLDFISDQDSDIH